MKTLKEVVDIVGLNRRAIQEYEDAELAKKPTERNKYGHLLYDSQAIERLWQLRFYKELGYNRTQIKSILEDESYNEQKEMENVLKALEEKRDKLNDLISIAQMMEETGLSFNSLKNGVVGFENAKSDNVFSILASSINIFNIPGTIENAFESIFADEDYGVILDAKDKIIGLFEMGESVDADEVQEGIKGMHKIMAKALSESIIIFQSTLLLLSPETGIAKELIEDVGENNYNDLREALQIYCEINKDNAMDKAFIEAVENVEKYGRKKYTTKSDEVQTEVARMHDYFKQIPILSEDAQLEVVRRLGQAFGSKAYKDVIDNGAKRGIAWFISRAIEVYCDNLNKSFGTEACQ
ncbi:MAG: MerR family transcriptional regulator [Lachnospiraceae bacterium]|nr:MerR family transcriptional regulator [Lachnospiraceae bacterium]